MKPVRRIIRLLQSGRVTIEKRRRLDGGLWGWCHHEDRVLYIYRRLREKSQVRILIHESLHFLYPAADEVWIYEQEKIIFSGLLHEEFLELCRMLRGVQ